MSPTATATRTTLHQSKPIFRARAYSKEVVITPMLHLLSGIYVNKHPTSTVLHSILHLPFHARSRADLENQTGLEDGEESKRDDREHNEKRRRRTPTQDELEKEKDHKRKVESESIPMRQSLRISHLEKLSPRVEILSLPHRRRRGERSPGSHCCRRMVQKRINDDKRWGRYQFR